MEDCVCVHVCLCLWFVCVLECRVEGCVCVCDRPAVSWVAGERVSSIQHWKLPVHEEALK